MRLKCKIITREHTTVLESDVNKFLSTVVSGKIRFIQQSDANDEGWVVISIFYEE